MKSPSKYETSRYKLYRIMCALCVLAAFIFLGSFIGNLIFDWGGVANILLLIGWAILMFCIGFFLADKSRSEF